MTLRVALVAGQLTYGGAEKQVVYMARALHRAGVSVQVYTFGAEVFYEAVLREVGLRPIVIGAAANPLVRLVMLARALRRFRPHVAQAGQFYVNLYVALASRLCGSLAIGAIRSDGVRDVQNVGRWGPLSLRAPSALVTNSLRARDAVMRLGVDKDKIHVVPNVVDTGMFDRASRSRPAAPEAGRAVVLLVAQLIRAKRVDRFLEALALARRSTPGLTGLVVGDGPERPVLEASAGRLGLLPHGVAFCGVSDDVPRLMADAQMLALTSDQEGLPNVILEAMAARLPVVSTPAGDAAKLIDQGMTGFVVPLDATQEFAERLVQLAWSPPLRQQLGDAGYERVKARYACDGLADRLLGVYRAAARHSGYVSMMAKLPPSVTAPS